MNADTKNTILIGGGIMQGKTSCLRHISNPERVIYLNCEGGKKPPFRSKFKMFTIENPDNVISAFNTLKEDGSNYGKYDIIVIDSITHLMSKFFSQKIHNKEKTLSKWNDYAEFIKYLFNTCISKCGLHVVVTAHIVKELNDQTMKMETVVDVKGYLRDEIESFFTTVVYAKEIKTSLLEDFANNHLTISDTEKQKGLKYVLQTQTDKDVSEKLRSPIDMWTHSETYINGDISTVLTKLEEYYV